MTEKELGFIAYEAARQVTGCSQGWVMADQEKWIAAALAVRRHDYENHEVLQVWKKRIAAEARQHDREGVKAEIESLKACSCDSAGYVSKVIEYRNEILDTALAALDKYYGGEK